MSIKKKNPARIWGINSDKIKKNWIEYIENCVDLDGLWVATYILKSHVDKYVKKKKDYFIEQQKK